VNEAADPFARRLHLIEADEALGDVHADEYRRRV
jgi:hypothetical protein